MVSVLDDSRWLQLEVCREFQRNKCTRPDTECKFAHPPAQVEVQNGRVTACYDSIKGRCNREKPPCKYYHPPQHLKDQLLINGRNHLALKNALMQQMGMAPGQPMLSGQLQALETEPCYFQASPYLGVHQLSGAAYPFVSASPMLQMMSPTDAASLGVMPTTVMAAAPSQNGTKVTRSDRIEPAVAVSHAASGQSAAAAHSTPSLPGMTPGFGISVPPPPIASMAQNSLAAAGAAAAVDATRKRPREEELQLMGFPGMVQYKRSAGDKSGVPVYQPATAYQQAALMQLQQPFVPVSCEYSTAASNLDSSQEQKSDSVVTSSENNPTDNDQRQGITTVASNLGYIVTPSGAVKRDSDSLYSLPSAPAVQANHFAAFNPLSYTGLSLNKQLTQAAALQQQQNAQLAGLQMQYPAFMQAQLQGLNLPGMGMQGYFPYHQAMNQQLQFLQPSQSGLANLNQYALLGGLQGMGMGGLQGMNMMPGFMQASPNPAQAVLPAVQGAASALSPAQAAAMAQAGLNPYKKMRTM